MRLSFFPSLSSLPCFHSSEAQTLIRFSRAIFHSGRRVNKEEPFGGAAAKMDGLKGSILCSASAAPTIVTDFVKWSVRRTAIIHKWASIYDVRSRWEGGSPKSRRKEQNELICDSDKGGGT